MRRIANLLIISMCCVVLAMLVLGATTSAKRDDSRTIREAAVQATNADLTAIDSGSKLAKRPLASGFGSAHPVIIRKPDGPPRIKLAGVDPQGRIGIAACSTCHAVRKPNPENISAATLDEFHQDMMFNHGKIACYACHNPDDSDALRLADGTSVAYEDVMTLCAQCHGPQATAFAHGAHGGMNGHWDLSRGPQMKNNCIDCHDPHSPAYPKMIVGFKPRDRFNAPAQDDHEHQESDANDDH